MAISMSKEYTTRDGCDVRIYAIVDGEWSVHGAVKTLTSWRLQLWNYKGNNSEMGWDWDLIEKKRKFEINEWVAIGYPGGVQIIGDSREEAIERYRFSTGRTPFACINIKRTITEGEGLE